MAFASLSYSYAFQFSLQYPIYPFSGYILVNWTTLSKLTIWFSTPVIQNITPNIESFVMQWMWQRMLIQSSFWTHTPSQTRWHCCWFGQSGCTDFITEASKKDLENWDLHWHQCCNCHRQRLRSLFVVTLSVIVTVIAAFLLNELSITATMHAMSISIATASIRRQHRH